MIREGKTMKTSIKAGKISDISWSNGTWLILDIGFAKTGKKSCGLLIHSQKQEKADKGEFDFNDAVKEVKKAAENAVKTKEALNLIIEAPLSVAFDGNGNPTPRLSIAVDKRGKPTPICFEKQGSQTRYWYLGLGCGLIVATLHLMRPLNSVKPRSEIRLFEAFVSFKTKDDKSKKQKSHLKDVESLGDLIQDPEKLKRCIHNPADPALPGINSSYRVESAFKVAGLDFGVPPVIMPNDR
jgi:hypothetical protein